MKPKEVDAKLRCETFTLSVDPLTLPPEYWGNARPKETRRENCKESTTRYGTPISQSNQCKLKNREEGEKSYRPSTSHCFRCGGVVDGGGKAVHVPGGEYLLIPGTTRVLQFFIISGLYGCTRGAGNCEVIKIRLL